MCQGFAYTALDPESNREQVLSIRFRIESVCSRLDIESRAVGLAWIRRQLGHALSIRFCFQTPRSRLHVENTRSPSHFAWRGTCCALLLQPACLHLRLHVVLLLPMGADSSASHVPCFVEVFLWNEHLFYRDGCPLQKDSTPAALHSKRNTQKWPARPSPF